FLRTTTFSSAMPRLFIHVIYAISLSLYPFTERHAQPYFFSCLIRQRGVTKALSDPAWVEAIQEELLQFTLQKVWILVDLPKGKKAIGYTQEEGIDYDEVFAPVARIEAIRLFLAYASFMRVMVYQMDAKNAFLYERIEKEEGVKEDGIFISQDKYVVEVLRKFNFSYVKSAITPVNMEKTLVKDTDGDDVDVHLYRSMIGSLMYLTASRTDIIDYVGASLDMKSTTRGCQFLGSRLISWQCKKQTMVATFTTEAEYVAAASYYGQLVWI
nr:ribonuclease H-like domain, reverse transcriptase, RNA-dependent DNA polymerase [Tanacetum cinerariifolium]